MKIQSIQNYNVTNNNLTQQNYQSSQVKSSVGCGKTYSQSFGIGVRGALNESIAQGQKILKMADKSPELVDMAERFHTCPNPVIKKVSAVYEWNGGIMNFLGVKDYNEVKSEKAYNKFSNAINNVISKKPSMTSRDKAVLNAKAKECYDQYSKYANI